ncbi:hypothetical protein F4778DRAFT_715029 [Xylariomycetidae sp. FL2044]|nr:hypothetical protein F4778DRAFT_715029 [Xylariomycetidae sp. FL2044]
MAESLSSGPHEAANPRPHSHRPRGGRSRGRGHRHQRNQQPIHDNHEGGQGLAGAGVDVSASSSQPSQDANPSNRGGRRGGRAGRNPARGSNRGIRHISVGGRRAFGGRLTSAQQAGEPATSAVTSLSPDAPAFVPGQPIATISSSSTNRHQQPAALRRGSKSTAEDLPTRIHEDIDNGQYECVICTNEVLRNSKVWSCSICWTVTHMSCVKKWYANRTRNGDQEQQPSWRCPGCNSPMTDEPATYSCWCGKEINPKPIPGLSPHSCGQTCSKPRGTCPHPCPLQCHSGPCPPCLLMGPSQPCFCGKETSTKRCGETDYTHGWSCHQICGDLLACGEHECPRECHPGLCGSCEVPVTSICYCGREVRDIPCDQRGDKIESYDHGQVLDSSVSTKSDDLPDSWYWGSFDCGTPCGRLFDCEKHKCQKNCHPEEELPSHCPFSPDIVSHCPCGKTPLEEILQHPRTSCQDPIPNCAKACSKPLGCGHFCQSLCHSGPCAPCMQEMEVTCRCGRTNSTSICHRGTVYSPECMRVCRAQLNCGRHEHGEHCCPGERRAIERVAARRKNKVSSSANNDFEAEHICIRPCGRELKCGKHRCQQMCHRGPCPSCLEAVFEEISCNCGRTVLQPPQPCGTKPPECRFDCTRQRDCGHPQIPHACHTSPSCPKCPFLVEKPCICGKQKLKNQPCWFEEPRCGLPCNKKLKCGTHTCAKLCHRPGECEDADIRGSRCKQPCGKPRSCGHLDVEQCHAPYPCKEDTPCQAKTFVTCDCQHRRQEVKCTATRDNPSPQRPTLKCDDECLRLQRNARLANALNIDPDTHTTDHVPYSDTTLKYFRENAKWAQTYEREFRVFAEETNEKRLRFKPMKPYQRAFIHSLAEDFGFDSESSDPEPHRHVCLFKTPRFVSAPMKTLAQCLKIRTADQGQFTDNQVATAGPSEMVPTLPFNALLLTAPKFGMTVEELDGALKKEYATHPTVAFRTSFLPSDEVVVKGSGSWTSQTLEAAITALKPALSQTVKRLHLAEDVFLCHVDDSLNVLRREIDPRAKSNGWNAVVGRSAARPQAPRTPAPVSVRSKFVALRKEPKKKVEEQPVEEDWEVAAEKLDGE